MMKKFFTTDYTDEHRLKRFFRIICVHLVRHEACVYISNTYKDERALQPN